MKQTPQLLVFDLFDTILDKEWFDYEILLDHLNDHYLSGFDRRTITEWAYMFRHENMLERDVTNKESSFTEQLKYYEMKAHVHYHEDYESIEWDLFRVCRRERVGTHVPETLDYLKKRGYPMAILSNSIFSSKCLSKYLDSFGLSDYFDSVYSSADLGIRKPSPLSFKHVCEDFRVEPCDTCFIGNNKEKDYKGAMNAGLNAIYYNRLNEKCGINSISDMSELIDILG